MVDKWIELAPEDVVWDNIDVGRYSTCYFIVSYPSSIARMVR